MGTCHDVDAEGRAARWAALWALLAGQEEELVEVAKDISKECFSERITGQTVEIAVPHEGCSGGRKRKCRKSLSCRMRWKALPWIRSECNSGPARYRSIWWSWSHRNECNSGPPSRSWSTSRSVRTSSMSQCRGCASIFERDFRVGEVGLT